MTQVQKRHEKYRFGVSENTQTYLIIFEDLETEFSGQPQLSDRKLKRSQSGKSGKRSRVIRGKQHSEKKIGF